MVHELEPLAEGVREDVGESMDVAEHDIVRERECVEVRRERQLPAWI
jgi:hypothetical protein